MQRAKYKIEMLEGKYRGKKQWRVRIKFSNDKIFMHSEYYTNKTYVKELVGDLRFNLRNSTIIYPEK